MIRSLIFVLAVAASAQAQEKKPGTEMQALQPLVGTFSFSDGKVAAGAMGPGSPEAKSRGRHSCRPTLNGMWIVCDLDDTAGEGKAAQKWSAHLVMGWDVEARQYKAVGADNMGSAWVMTGRVEKTKVVWESGEMIMMGQPVKFRITIDWSGPGTLKLTDERSTKGGPWTVAETATMKK